MGLEVSGGSELFHTHAIYECVGRCIARACEWNGSTVAKTFTEARLTSTLKLALDAVHRCPLGKDLHLELASGEEVKGID